ncbi:hypothetical protein JHK87_040574 [Glycine soja]|nr:hypothetical protein JHK87_040574 [Glycine soja]
MPPEFHSDDCTFNWFLRIRIQETLPPRAKVDFFKENLAKIVYEDDNPLKPMIHIDESVYEGLYAPWEVALVCIRCSLTIAAIEQPSSSQHSISKKRKTIASFQLRSSDTQFPDTTVSPEASVSSTGTVVSGDFCSDRSCCSSSHFKDLHSVPSDLQFLDTNRNIMLATHSNLLILRCPSTLNIEFGKGAQKNPNLTHVNNVQPQMPIENDNSGEMEVELVQSSLPEVGQVLRGHG